MLQGNDESVAKDSWLRKRQLSLFCSERVLPTGKGLSHWGKRIAANGHPFSGVAPISELMYTATPSAL
jgi:hypothetical protein